MKKGNEKDVLTIEAFRTEHTHYTWYSVVEERCSHRIPHRKLSYRLYEKTTIFEGSHCICPRLAARIHETTVYPARHFVYLQSHVFTTISR